MYHLIKIPYAIQNYTERELKKNIIEPQLEIPFKTFEIEVRFRAKPSVRITKDGRKYYPSDYIKWKKETRIKILKAVNSINEKRELKKNVNLYIVFYFKKKYKGDIDNLLKSALDIFKGILYRDDSQVKQVCAKIIEFSKNDKIEVYYRYWR